jgi:hypothetical protein
LRQRALATAIAILLVADLGVVVARTGDDPHPDRWDPRVAEIARWVERARGLQFDHPVPVELLSAADYTKATTAPPLEDDDDDTVRELADQVALLRALGVVSGSVDLRAAIDQANDSGTLAYYDPTDETIRIRGTEITVGLRVTLAHELTHVLQDQHFDVGELLGDADDSGEALARRALAEGDADRIQQQYVDTELSAAERDEYATELRGEVDQSTANTAGVPDFVAGLFTAPYALGPPFVALLHDRGGNGGVDDGFRSPPSTEEHVFDPASYLAGEGAHKVDLGKVEDRDVFGITAWYLVLAQRMDPSVAFEAALGWDGDGMGRIDRDGRTCVRAVFRGDSEEDEEQMADAIAAWAAALPAHQGRAIQRGGRPGLEACDPGPDVDQQVPPRSRQLLTLPNTWGFLQAEVARVLPPSGIRCFARTVLTGITIDRLNDPTQLEPLRAQIRDRAQGALSRCD